MSRRPTVREHGFEPQHGLPEVLPGDERLLWQGAPSWRAVARHALHARLFALYFAVLMVWRFASALYDGAGLGAALVAVAWTLPLVALALGYLAGFAKLVERTTVYTLTDRRVVMRIGVVLTVTFNLPLKRIETARLHALGGGHGDIALVLHPDDRIGYFHLWPHARPWKLQRTEPMLRCIPDVERVSALLAQALSECVPAPSASATSATVRPARLPAQSVSPGARRQRVATDAA